MGDGFLKCGFGCGLGIGNFGFWLLYFFCRFFVLLFPFCPFCPLYFVEIELTSSSIASSIVVRKCLNTFLVSTAAFFMRSCSTLSLMAITALRPGARSTNSRERGAALRCCCQRSQTELGVVCPPSGSDDSPHGAAPPAPCHPLPPGGIGDCPAPVVCITHGRERRWWAGSTT